VARTPSDCSTLPQSHPDDSFSPETSPDSTTLSWMSRRRRHASQLFQALSEILGSEAEARRTLEVLATKKGPRPRPDPRVEEQRRYEVDLLARVGETYQKLAKLLGKATSIGEDTYTEDVAHWLTTHDPKDLDALGRRLHAAVPDQTHSNLAAAWEKQHFNHRYPETDLGTKADELRELTGWTWPDIARLVLWHEGDPHGDVEKKAASLRQAASAARRRKSRRCI